MNITREDDYSDQDDDNVCLQQMRDITSPSYLGKLFNMVSWTGKGINELGNFEACDTDELEYILINVGIKGQPFVVARIGICSPRKCSSPEYFTGITSFIDAFAKSMVPPGSGLEVESFVEVPREINSQSLSAGAWAMIMVIIFLVMLWLLGILVTYTKVGDREEIRNGVQIRTRVEARKTKWALALLSFNPIINLQKLFTVKAGGDDNLAVLNGVRVLSICWVIVGHGFVSVLFAPVKNMGTMNMIFENGLFSLVSGGVYAVDSFFYLSGFLTFYLLAVKMYPKRGNIGLKNTLLIYFHRYYRLFFPLAFVMFFTMSLIYYTGDGPFYRSNWRLFVYDSCKNYWWSNLLYINNFVPFDISKE